MVSVLIKYTEIVSFTEIFVDDRETSPVPFLDKTDWNFIGDEFLDALLGEARFGSNRDGYLVKITKEPESVSIIWDLIKSLLLRKKRATLPPCWARGS